MLYLSQFSNIQFFHLFQTYFVNNAIESFDSVVTIILRLHTIFIILSMMHYGMLVKTDYLGCRYMRHTSGNLNYG